MKRLSILTFQFYRLLLLYNIACTIIGWVLMRAGGLPLTTVSLLFAKLIGFAGAIGLHYYNSKNTYYYFRNAGLSMRWIFVSTLGADILVYFVLITLSTLIPNV
ncbi:MAG: hypothetical protein ACXVIY_13240 [Mucilaginibacter sp.]